MSEIHSNEAIGFTPTPFRRWLGAVDIATGALPLVMWAAVGLAVFYALTIAYGAISGYGLPTTAIFSVVPHGEAIGRGEKYLPRLLLVIAIAGTVIDWARSSDCRLPRPARNEALAVTMIFQRDAGCRLPHLSRNEGLAARLFLRWGLLIICLIWVLALSANGWSGRISSLDHNQYASFAGLFPHFDASGHYISPIEQVLTGSWSTFASRRPFAAGMRHLMEAAVGFSYVWTLILQTLLVAAALFAAARSVIIWRGIWAGFAFCAFGYLITRPFIDSMLTEPIGLAWGLLSVMFLVDAMRLHNTRYAFLGLITLTFAEITRMGSVFTIPALVLWIALAFGDTLRARARLFAIGCGAVLAVLLVQSVCAYLYGNPASTTGGNFSYVLCGLAEGNDWNTCPTIFAQEFSKLSTERARDAFLYSRAIQAVIQNPGVLVSGLVDNIRTFVSYTPTFVLTGFGGPIQVFPAYGLLLLVPGLIFTLWCNRARGELLFWFLMLASMVVSAGLIIRDDGWRTMSVTWPILALLLSFGCTSPATSGFDREFKPLVTARTGLVLIAAMIVAVIAAPAATRVWPGRELRSLSDVAAAASSHEAVLFGRTLTGFLVIPDNVRLPKQTPAIHLSTFVDLMQNVELEHYYGPFLDIAIKKVPFAFVTAARINDPSNQFEQDYLAPADILTQGPTKAWRVTFADTLHGRWIRDVVKVQPVR